ncbi:MAG: efflux RND transporter periplasmic adaptor subunit [Epsilonproteobacteria bacterium]|nr:efflux RND transporter periplasmic adaptor subunit [Campylobacterota bacterium]
MKKLLFTLLTTFALFTQAHAQEIYAIFDVEALHDAKLSMASGGVIKTIKVDIGDSVKKGDLLIELDNADLKASVGVAEANYKSAQTSLKYAQRAYNRQQKVKELIDQAEFDKFKLDLESAKTYVSQMKAALTYQRSLLAKSRLTAPFDGVISDKLTEIGNAISGGNPKTLLNLQSYEIKLVITFDAQHWDSVKVGNMYRYKIDGSDTEFTGKISKIYPSIDKETRMIKAEVEAKDIPIGLFGTGHIITE